MVMCACHKKFKISGLLWVTWAICVTLVLSKQSWIVHSTKEGHYANQEMYRLLRLEDVKVLDLKQLKVTPQAQQE